MFPAASSTTQAHFNCDTCGKNFTCKHIYDKHLLYHDVEKITGLSLASETSGASAESGVAMYQHDVNLHIKVEMDDSGASHCEQQQAAMSQPHYPPMPHKSAHKTTNNAVKQERQSELYAPFKRLKIHACDECEKSYTRKDHLARHKLVHIGDKPHVCTICLKAFIRKDKLQRHERIHFKDTKFECRVCGKSFLRKDGLNKHFSSVHVDHAFPSSYSSYSGNSSKTQSDSKHTSSVVNTSVVATVSGDSIVAGKIASCENISAVPKNNEPPGGNMMTTLTSASNVVFPTIHPHDVMRQNAAHPMTL